jgi:predicted RNA-binding Zn ribbon-like protein
VQSSDWKDGFPLIGNQLALDFLNTRPVQDGGPTELLSDFSALIRWFRAAGLLSSRDAGRIVQRWGESARARRTVQSMRELRETLRKEILSWERHGTVHQSTADKLNSLMAAHPMHTRLKAHEKGFDTEPYLAPEEPEDLFAPIAHSASMLFANVDRKRVRKCDQCVLHFEDISKKGSRRWCSMQLCGNRQKVAAYAARQRRVGRSELQP